MTDMTDTQLMLWVIYLLGFLCGAVLEFRWEVRHFGPLRDPDSRLGRAFRAVFWGLLWPFTALAIVVRWAARNAGGALE